MRFSERQGHRPIRAIIQINNIDEALKNSLWSALNIYYWETIRHDNQIFPKYYLSFYGNDKLNLLFKRLWLHYFKKPIDTLPDDWDSALNVIRNYYFKAEWFEIYDFIEFVPKHYDVENTNSGFREMCNEFLQRELSGYRFVDNKISPITSEEEIAEIEEALTVKKTPVREHLQRSLELISDRKDPDYRNSIKESISAVEAVAIAVTGEEKATLGQLLNMLERKSLLHPALKEAFSKLYGYTSSADGIRHALLEESEVSFEKAKFMLVACSAFINYVSSTIKFII